MSANSVNNRTKIRQVCRQQNQRRQRHSSLWTTEFTPAKRTIVVNVTVNTVDNGSNVVNVTVNTVDNGLSVVNVTVNTVDNGFNVVNITVNTVDNGSNVINSH